MQDIFGQGNQVAVRVTVSGTQKGALIGIPASGRNIQWTGEDDYTLTDGKISSVWAGDDWTSILYDTGEIRHPGSPDSLYGAVIQRPRHQVRQHGRIRCRGRPVSPAT